MIDDCTLVEVANTLVVNVGNARKAQWDGIEGRATKGQGRGDYIDRNDIKQNGHADLIRPRLNTAVPHLCTVSSRSMQATYLVYIHATSIFSKLRLLRIPQPAREEMHSGKSLAGDLQLPDTGYSGS
jgi:hypothetical protein